MYKRIFFAVFCLTAFFLHAQEADIQTEQTQVEANIRAEQPDGTRYKITEIVYKISGLTKQTPLSKAVPIEKDTLFFSKEELEEYIETLNIEFKNLRTLESHRIETEFLPAEDPTVHSVADGEPGVQEGMPAQSDDVELVCIMLKLNS